MEKTVVDEHSFDLMQAEFKRITDEWEMKLLGERKAESLTSKGLSGGDVSKGDKLISKKGKEIARPTLSNKGRGSERAVDGVNTRSAQKKNASRASESGRESPTISPLLKNLRFFSNVEAAGIATIVVLWNLSMVKVDLIDLSTQAFHVSINSLESQYTFATTFVYDFNMIIARRQLWDDLRDNIHLLTRDKELRPKLMNLKAAEKMFFAQKLKSIMSLIYVKLMAVGGFCCLRPPIFSLVVDPSACLEGYPNETLMQFLEFLLEPPIMDCVLGYPSRPIAIFDLHGAFCNCFGSQSGYYALLLLLVIIWLNLMAFNLGVGLAFFYLAGSLCKVLILSDLLYFMLC
ncbi:hypothetical protein Peur_004869 [Populus x canadensis]